MGKMGIRELRKIKSEIVKRYNDGESTYKMAKIYNTYPQQINILLTECNVKIRPANIINNREMSDSLKQIVNGWLLGDGHIASVGNQAYFSLSSKHEEYVDYVADLFAAENISSKKYKSTQFNKNYYRIHTLSTVQLGELHKKWYKDKKKFIPDDLKITPLVVKHWIMDDGTYDKKMGHMRLCTNCFTIEECDKLANELNKFAKTNDIHTIEKGKGTTRVYLSKNSTNKLYDKIGCLPVPCFNYKKPNNVGKGR